jgi:signal transduction histidine kinase
MAAPNEHISSSSRLGLDQHDAEIESYTSSETSSWRKMNIRGSTSVQPSSGKVSTFFTSWSPRAVSLFMFVIFSAAIIPVIQVFVQAQKQEIKDKAIDMAVDTGEWFSDQLDRAILPLFSMAQFSTNLEIFRSLPEKIGVSHAPGSLPFIDGTYLRNVTGVCDDPELVSRFTSIASGAKKHAKMDGLLVNIQLAPQGVICLLHPMNNTEDFEDGKFLDSSGAWGLDLFDSPSMNYIARESIKNEEISVAGPIKLTQCPTCDPFFIARLPIVYDGHQIEVDGVNYNRWGFTTALIDWKRLVEESGIYDSFREANLEFQLTRTDRNLNSETGDYVEEVVILAETEGYLKSRSLMKAVSTTLETTNNEWEISVLYSVADVVMWNVTMVGIGGFVSLCMAFLIYMILRQRHIHVDMLSASREKEAKIDTERNITAYFAHELRNPLSAMDNAMAILLDNSLPPGTQETVDAMQRCSDFMSGIMNNLLDVRKLEEGKLEIRENPVSLTALVDDTHKMLAPLVKSEVDFLAQIDVLPERDWVLGDFARLQQAFVNITTNAIKYTHKGSITIKTSWEGEMVKLECIDTGPGIPKSEQARLFERFVQRGGAPGTGLGLNISKQLVEVMGGTICFESDPKVKPGTTCIISLPLTPCEQPEKEAKTGGSKPIEEEITVLIIDDISMNRTMLSRRIQKFIAPNAKITSVETGEIAVEICEDQSFDVMICDQYMEEAGGAMLGTDFIIAARRKRMDSFIIGCSGNDLDASFFDAGADRVWGKPLPKNEEIIDHFREGLQGRYPQIYC